MGISTKIIQAKTQPLSVMASARHQPSHSAQGGAEFVHVRGAGLRQQRFWLGSFNKGHDLHMCHILVQSYCLVWSGP